MYIQCAYKNAARNVDVETYAVAKIRSRVEKLVSKPVGIHVKFEARCGRETTNCRIIAGDGQSINACYSAGSFYQAIDGLVDIIAEQLRRRKAKRHAAARKAAAPRFRHLAAGEGPILDRFDEEEWDGWFYEGQLPH